MLLKVDREESTLAPFHTELIPSLFSQIRKYLDMTCVDRALSSSSIRLCKPGIRQLPPKKYKKIVRKRLQLSFQFWTNFELTASFHFLIYASFLAKYENDYVKMTCSLHV